MAWPTCNWLLSTETGSRRSVVATLTGRHADLLTVERTMLNLLGHLSGIATATRRLVDLVAGTQAAICGNPQDLARLARTAEARRALRWRPLASVWTLRCSALQRQPLGHHAFIGDGSGSRLQGLEAMGPIRFVEVEVDTLDQLDTVLSFESGVVDIICWTTCHPK